MPVLLAHFAVHPKTDALRLPELRALLRSVGVMHECVLGAGHACDADAPELLSVASALHVSFSAGGALLLVALPEGAAAAATRAVLLRGLHRVLVAAPTVDGLHRSVAAGGAGLMAAVLTAPSYKYEVESLGRHYALEEKQAFVKPFAALEHAGRLDLTDPAMRVALYLHHAAAGGSSAASNAQPLPVAAAVLAVPEVVTRRQPLLDRYNLKLRRYIGTTTMPPELTFLMANLAGVAPGAVVMDPFAGTGSTLLSGAEHGAFCIGSDMDGRVLRGGAIVGAQAEQALAVREKDRRRRFGDASCTAGPPTFRSNFADAGVPAADVLRLNFAAVRRVYAAGLIRGGFLDAIVTDPPYGLRERKLKVKTRDADKRPRGEADGAEAAGVAALDCRNEQRSAAGGKSEDYGLRELLLDLVEFAAAALVMGGALVYWHPTTTRGYTDAEIPVHPSFVLEANVAQGLTLKTQRRLVVFRKVAPVPEDYDAAAARAALREPELMRDALHDGAPTEDPQWNGYRGRREARREAVAAWKAEHDVPERPRLSRAELRAANIANRARNVEERDAKQRAHGGSVE